MSDDAFLAPRSATRFCAAFLAALAAVVAYSLLDHPKAAAVEKFEQTTAAGDTAYYVVPTPALAVPEPVLRWQDHAWAPASDEKVKIDDPDMQRVATDEASALTVYQPRGKAPGTYFIKLAVGEYLRIEPR